VSREDWPELKAEALRLLRVGDIRSPIERVWDSVTQLTEQFGSYRSTAATFGDEAARLERELDVDEDERRIRLLVYLAGVNRSKPIRMLLDELDDSQQDAVERILAGVPDPPSG
jgi:hypothetical protein